MTKITFFENKGLLTAFEISGHTEKDVAGKDILCSAISTASQMIVWGIVNELKLKTELIQKDGFLKLTLSNEVASQKQVQLLMRTGLNSLKNIVRNEKKYVKLEVKYDI